MDKLKFPTRIALLATLAVMVNAQAKIVESQTVGVGDVPKFVGAKHFPYANPDAPKGGTLSMSASGTFNSLNPFIDKGTPASGASYYPYDSLMLSSLDEVAIMYPLLATGVTYDDEDAGWIIYHLNKQAKFWDGTPVTADDVKATFDAILTKGLMSWRSYLSDVDKVEVVDKHTVKFIFKTSDNKEISMLVAQMPIFAKASIDKDFEKVSLTPLMGSGPYKVGKIDAGRSISYVRDPNYWGWDVMVNRGRFNFDTLKYVYYQSDEIAFEGFKSGQYRFRVENRSRNWATAYTFPAAKSGQVIKESIEEANPIPMQGLVLNLRRDIFSDIKVRKAMNLAFDFEWMNPVLFYGIYERLQSYFQGSELSALGKPDANEISILQSLSLNDYEKSALEGTPTPYRTNADGYNRENLLKARELLLQAGFSYKDGKLYTDKGVRAKVEILEGSNGMNRVLLPYIRNLKRLGFDASIRQVDRPQYLQRIREFDYDMMIDVFAQSSSPGAEQAYFWGSAAADEKGNQNTIGIKSKALDQAITKLMNANGRQDVITYTKIIDRLLQSGYYVVPMYGKGATNVAYWKEYKHPEYMPKYGLSLDYWWANGSE